MNNLICPICEKKLIRVNNSYKCEHNHSYDISKQGYLNLLLNSKNSGDNKEMIESRYQFLKKGYYSKLLIEIIEILKKLNIKNILDIGCGEGYYDRGISSSLDISMVGIDISKEACLKASKLDKSIFYIVSGMNKIPFLDNEFDLILNIFAPHDENEFSRVCNNYILKVIPNKYHLLELKQLLYEDVIIKPEKRLVFKNFEEIMVKEITYKVEVEDLFELFKMTPYYYKTKYDKKLFQENKKKIITCDFIILLYKKYNN